MRALTIWSRRQGALLGRLGVDRGADRAALPLARTQGLEKPVSNQPQYSLLWRRIEDTG